MDSPSPPLPIKVHIIALTHFLEQRTFFNGRGEFAKTGGGGGVQA